jgi:hypothetical protein
MKRPRKVAGAGPAVRRTAGAGVALALTWDGARWPARSLPPKARAFLSGRSRAVLSGRETAELFADDQVNEIRICWVPRLKGGNAVLSEPFGTPRGTRLGFQPIKTVRFGDILGVVYRRYGSQKMPSKPQRGILTPAQGNALGKVGIQPPTLKETSAKVGLRPPSPVRDY